MKRALILGLVGLNIVLLAALTLAPDPPKAYGQAVRHATDYLVVTGHYENDYDALYIIDLAKRKMCYFLFDRVQKQMIPYGMRKLRIDFPAVEEPR
jgi:hypothetical protein